MNNNICSRLKLVLIYLLAVAFIIVYFAPFTYANIERNSYVFYTLSNNDLKHDILSLESDDIVEQRVELPANRQSEYLDIETAYNADCEDPRATFLIKLITADGNEYTADDLFWFRTYDRQWLRVRLPEAITNVTHDEPFVVTVLITALSPSSLLVSSESMEVIAKYSLNNNKLNNTLVVRASIHTNSVWCFILWGVLIASGLILCLTVNGLTTRSFITISSVFGILYLFIIHAPSVFETGQMVNIFRNVFSPCLIESEKSVWLPSRLLSDISYNTSPFALLTGDYHNYALQASIGIQFINWMYYPPLILARLMNLSSTALLYFMRAYGFILCIILNSIAVHRSGRIRPVIFTIALLPMSLLAISSVSSYGILLSLLNLFLALAYSAFGNQSDGSAVGISHGKAVCMMIVMFIICMNNLVLGLLAFVLLNYAVRNSKNTKLILCGALIFCAALAVNVVYIILSKGFYDQGISAINDHINTFFVSPAHGIIQAVRSVVKTAETAILSSVDRFTAPGLILAGMLAGILLLQHVHGPLSADNNAFPHTISLTVISLTLTGLYALSAAITGVLTAVEMTGLFAPFTAFIAASVYSGRETSGEGNKSRIIPFILIVLSVFFLASVITM